MKSHKNDEADYPRWLKKEIERLEADGRKYTIKKLEDGSYSLNSGLIPEKDLSLESQAELQRRMASGERVFIQDLDAYFAQF